MKDLQSLNSHFIPYKAQSNVDLGGHAIIAYGFGKYNGVVYWK